MSPDGERLLCGYERGQVMAWVVRRPASYEEWLGDGVLYLRMKAHSSALQGGILLGGADGSIVLSHAIVVILAVATVRLSAVTAGAAVHCFRLCAGTS